MKLHLAGVAGQNTITGYGPGFVLVNGIRHAASLVVLPDRLLTDWQPAGPASIEPEDLAPLVGMDLELVLLGTGERLRFPRPEVMRSFAAAGMGLEVMDVYAACRTFNILAGEGRRVAAALVIEAAQSARLPE